VEVGIESMLTLSSVDDVAWVIEEDDISQSIQRMRRCAVRVDRYAKRNAIEFDIGKTEATFFSKT
jgi:hypothetical protein